MSNPRQLGGGGTSRGLIASALPTQELTGMVVDHGALRVLDATTWEERRQRLNELGGPPDQ